MKDNSLMVDFMVKVLSIIKMVLNMMEIGLMVANMDMEYLSGLLVINMKVYLKLINVTVKEYFTGQMEIGLKVCTKMTLKMELEHITMSYKNIEKQENGNVDKK
jgi:hypothetical protein